MASTTDAKCEVGTCRLCSQELLRTPDDCWHPLDVERACPPEPEGSIRTNTREWQEWYAAGNRSGRPGRENFAVILRLDESAYTREWESLNHRLEPKLIACDHPHPDASICPECMGDFVQVLADIPDLLHHLELAIIRETKFVERGQPKEDTGESPLPFSEAASEAARDLRRNLYVLAYMADQRYADPVQAIFDHRHRLAKREDFPGFAGRISSAAAKAHRVIDAPPLPHRYGPCPKCGVEIEQERVHPNDDRTLIVCDQDDCDYAANLSDHMRTQLELGENRMLTVREIVEAFITAGMPVTRDQINGRLRRWIDREGLPREKRQVPVWDNGVLVPGEEQYVYRLGDVMRLHREAQNRRGAA